MNVKVRAALRTAAMLGIIAISCALVYAFAIFGMLPGVIILASLGLVFIVYDNNKAQIEYEDKLDEISKKSKV
jgi:c-di-AMP phosphodiesterase-like protein